MSEKIEPALTPEEWADRPARLDWRSAKATALNAYIGGDGHLWRKTGGRVSPKQAHRAAAMCLANAPFGFTWEDVDLLRGGADGLRCMNELTSHNPFAAVLAEEMAENDVEIGRLTSLADRIAALLPPREPKP